ncbi:MAG: thiamine-phosphate kinase [Candidatus Baltobacteraceae bacterium]
MRAKDTRISDEDALIARMRGLLEGANAPRRALNPIGDDVAVWQPSRSHRSVITTDALVEGVHFRRDLMTLHDAGYRAMASNLSDVAAAGARPVLATVALGVPAGTMHDDVLALYAGLADCGAQFGCTVAGGDLTAAAQLFLAVTLVAEVRASNVKGRGGARPGDIAAVTGPLGGSRAGLHYAGERMAPVAHVQAALDAFRRPQPRLAQGRWLAASAHVHALMDISDGLSTDLTRMCERSQCGAVVQSVPVAAAARACAAELRADPDAFALAGGEDFELLAAVSKRAFPHLARRFQAHFGSPLIAVGRFREGSGAAVINGVSETPLVPAGYDHFRDVP